MRASDLKYGKCCKKGPLNQKSGSVRVSRRLRHECEKDPSLPRLYRKMKRKEVVTCENDSVQSLRVLGTTVRQSLMEEKPARMRRMLSSVSSSLTASQVIVVFGIVSVPHSTGNEC